MTRPPAPRFIFVLLCLLSAAAWSQDYAKFDNIEVPATVRKNLDDARNPKAFGFPKFKMATYVLASASARAGKQYPFKTQITADRGLLRIKRGLGVFGDEQLAGFGGMVLFKSRGSGPFADGSVWVSDKMQLSFPTVPFEVGAKLNIDYEMTKVPRRPKDAPVQVVMSCEVSNVVDAKSIFPSLSGRALDMVCMGSNATKRNFVAYQTYLEDLGLVVPSTKASNPNAAHAHFVSFDIER